MSDFDNTNTITIFPNNNRSHEKAPDFTGKINVDGVEKDVALWKRESKSGTKFLSGKIQEPFKKNGDSKPAPKSKPKQESFDDDCPF